MCGSGIGIVGAGLDDASGGDDGQGSAALAVVDTDDRVAVLASFL